MKTVKMVSGDLHLNGQSYENLANIPGAKRAQKVTMADALQIMEPFELVHEDGHVQQGDAGDWILQAGKGDFYVVKDAVFTRIYNIATK
jgi:hypothetical protein